MENDKNAAPTRRSALHGIGLASIAAGLAVPALASAKPDDGDASDPLVRLMKTMTEQKSIADAIAAEKLPPKVSEGSEDKERRLSFAMDNWLATAEQMVDTPAQSPAGLQAKAEGFELLFAYFSSDDFLNVEDRLALSLTRDLLGGSAVT